MKKSLCIPAFVLTVTLTISSAIAHAETAKPRVLTLPDRADATLPGNQTQARHGVKINRGSGFPEPVVKVVEPKLEPVVPAPTQRRRIPRNRSRW
ncbi:MAG: hypothetical protein ABJM43_24030 [Paracoccaceae bacterium]